LATDPVSPSQLVWLTWLTVPRGRVTPSTITVAWSLRMWLSTLVGHSQASTAMVKTATGTRKLTISPRARRSARRISGAGSASDPAWECEWDMSSSAPTLG